LVHAEITQAPDDSDQAGRSGPALRALRRPDRRRRCWPPWRACRGWRARPRHPSPGMQSFVPHLGEPARPAYQRRWRGPHAVGERPWPHRRAGHGPDGSGRAGRSGRPERPGRHSLVVSACFRSTRRCRPDPDDRGHRHCQQQDHECQRGLEHSIQHDQTQVSHSSLLSRPVTGSRPTCPVLSGPSSRMKLSYHYSARHALARG